jgi:hypothetical protein
MAYKYDVFLSYNRKFPHGKWVNETFYQFFKSYLEDALNIRETRIFKDTDEIYSGQAWDLKIKNALIHSKIMVCVLSPAYFQSEWCKKEFAIMDYRQVQSGFLTIDNPNGLIVPIKIFDGEHFPPYANSLQIADFNKFSRLGLEKTPLYTDFQEHLLAWMPNVTHAYNNAPEWNNDWKHPGWIEKSWNDLDKLNSSPSKKPPTL